MKHATMNAVAWVKHGDDGYGDPEDRLPHVAGHFYAACTEALTPVVDCIALMGIEDETPSCPQCAVLLDEAWESQRSK